IHWADEATLDLVRFLGRRIHDTGGLLLVTYRDDALGPRDRLRIVLGELSTQRSTRRAAVSPLSELGVATLADGTGLAPDELYALTGGNPFFVDEILHAGTARVPPSARDAVLARVAPL